MPDPELIRTENLARRYRMGGETIEALRGVDLVVRRGEYAAIMGPSGCGKSTLMNIVGCLDTPDDGRYWLDGDMEIQQGYLPKLGQPQGTKLRRDSLDDKRYVVQWLTDRGETVMQQIAKKWRVREQEMQGFLERFAALVAAAERERNAQIADAHASIEGIAQVIAAEIRGQA